MENKQDVIAVFDTLFTNNHICMLKLLLPLLSPAGQKTLSIYIKYLELQYTLQYFKHHPRGLCLSSNTENSSADFDNIFENLLPYCTSREKQSITQMQNMLNSFRNMQEMMEMINMLKEMFPEGFEGNAEEMFDLFSGMSGVTL